MNQALKSLLVSAAFLSPVGMMAADNLFTTDWENPGTPLDA